MKMYKELKDEVERGDLRGKKNEGRKEKIWKLRYDRGKMMEMRSNQKGK